MRLDMAVVVDFAFGSPRATHLPGRLHPDFLDVEALRSLWGKRITVEGMAALPRLTDTRALLGPAG